MILTIFLILIALFVMIVLIAFGVTIGWPIVFIIIDLAIFIAIIKGTRKRKKSRKSQN